MEHRGPTRVVRGDQSFHTYNFFGIFLYGIVRESVFSSFKPKEAPPHAGREVVLAVPGRWTNLAPPPPNASTVLNLDLSIPTNSKKLKS